MNTKAFRSPVLRTLIALGVILGPNAVLEARPEEPCQVRTDGTSIFIRGGNLGGSGAWLEIKNAIGPNGGMGENYGLAEAAWEEMGCYGY